MPKLSNEEKIKISEVLVVLESKGISLMSGCRKGFFEFDGIGDVLKYLEHPKKYIKKLEKN